MKTEPSISDLKRKARELVVKTLYEMEMGDLGEEDARERIRRKCRRPEVRGFAMNLLDQTLAHMGRVDEIIAEVVENWDLSRMAAIDRNVLRLGVAEILFVEGVPEKVAINEAIEIAKRFSTENSGRFVNGVLDKVARINRDLRHNL
jgi:transcription antitermination factor NusB